MSLSSNDFNKRSRTITCISDFGTPMSREALVIRVHDRQTGLLVDVLGSRQQIQK